MTTNEHLLNSAVPTPAILTKSKYVLFDLGKFEYFRFTSYILGSKLLYMITKLVSLTT